MAASTSSSTASRGARPPAKPGRAGRRTASRPPSFAVVRALFAEGCQWVAGLDEVGRGAWAGPVAVGVAAVRSEHLRRVPKGVRDSKLLAEAAREALYEPLAGWCPAHAVGEASAQECDELGMTAAQALAARRAFDRLGLALDAVVVDGSFDYTGHPAARPLVDADATCTLVAAASVLAKVTRDRAMIAHDVVFPGYGFVRNKGYASREHRAAVANLGLSPLHRRSWAVRMDDVETDLSLLPPGGAD